MAQLGKPKAVGVVGAPLMQNGVAAASSAPAVVFPEWLKWALIGGAAFIWWQSRKRGGSLGSMLEPTRRERDLPEYHITDEDD